MPADLAAIQAIYAHHVLHGLASFEEEPPSLEELRRRHDDCVRRALPWLVSEIAGSVAARLGFVRSGTLRSAGFKFGRWVDSVVMQRPLGAGDASPP